MRRVRGALVFPVFLVALVALVALGASTGAHTGAHSRADADAAAPVSARSAPSRTDSLVLVPNAPALAGRVRIIHWPGSEGRAERTARVLDQFALLPGLPAERPAQAVVVLAPDEAIWAAWTGGQVPHWGAGVAIPSLDRIVLPLFHAPWSGGIAEDRTLRHEWAHLGLHDHLEGLRIPRWFDEGYAQWASGGWDASAGWKLRLGLARRNSPPLEALTLEWPRGRAEAELAYLLAASAVSYLVEDSGARGMEIFLTRWREVNSFETAMRETFGMTTAQFESRWIRHVERRYGWIVFLTQTGFIWGVLGVVLLVLFGIRRRRDRERMERLRQSEPADDAPATWWTPFS